MGCTSSINKNHPVFLSLEERRKTGRASYIEPTNLFCGRIFNYHYPFENGMSNDEIAYLFNNYSDVVKIIPKNIITSNDVKTMREKRFSGRESLSLLERLFHE
jgi:hypothetical protein